VASRLSVHFIWVAVALLCLAACASGEPSAPAADTSTLVREAESALEGGQVDLAIGKLQQALGQDDTSVEAHFILGNAYVQKEQFAQAEEQFRVALDLDQDNVDARSNLGVAYYRQGKLQQAEEAFRAALSLKPGDAEIHYNLGGVLAAQNRLDEAETQFLEAKRLNPALAEPYLGLGSIYRLQGRRDEAMAVLREYLRLSRDPTWRKEAEQMLRELESEQ